MSQALSLYEPAKAHPSVDPMTKHNARMQAQLEHRVLTSSIRAPYGFYYQPETDPQHEDVDSYLSARTAPMRKKDVSLPASMPTENYRSSNTPNPEEPQGPNRSRYKPIVKH